MEICVILLNKKIDEGDWKDDKANGYGVYTHVNGAKYEG